MIDKQGFQFDLETQRFIKNRWETVIGKQVHQKIVHAIKHYGDIRGILEGYVLDDENNSDPHGHPLYPPKEMILEGRFWVLTDDDLRGISFYHEDFSNSVSFGKKSLNYSYFYNCIFEKGNLSRTDLSFSRIEKCNLSNAYVANCNGLGAEFINCDFQKATMFSNTFIDCDFSGSDLTDAFLGDSIFENIKVNYLTQFDCTLVLKWTKVEFTKEKVPDVLRAIRIAYEKAELWDEADGFLLEEKRAFRKYILWERADEEKTIKRRLVWLKSYLIDFFSGYTTKPIRIILAGLVISLIFAVAYMIHGGLSEEHSLSKNIWESMYFSFTTFATLGYGDLSFKEAYPFMRIMSTVEAWLGAITISIFVAILARKILRSG